MLGQLALSTLANLWRSLSPAAAPDARAARRRALRESSKSMRRELRRLSGLALRRLSHPRPFDSKLVPTAIRSVLVCRLNGRLGNTLLLTPLLQSLHELLPDATIDLALSYPKAHELFAHLPGVRRIISFPHKDPRALWRYPAALFALGARRYDLAIDPVPESTSGRIALSLSRARWKLGFDTSSQWVALTHPVARPELVLHHGVEPVFLLARAFELPESLDLLAPGRPALWLPLEPAELATGRAALDRALAAAGAPRDGGALRSAGVLRPGGVPVGFFANATGAKRLGRAWWVEFWNAFLELEPEVIPVEFLPGPESPRVDPRFPSLHIRPLRELAAAISATRMFIAPDAGPMHLASSTAAPTIALFCASEISRYAPMKASDLAIDVTRCTAREAAARCRDLRRAGLGRSR